MANLFERQFTGNRHAQGGPGHLLGSDDGRKRVVAPDADTHEHTPEDEESDNGYGRRGCGESLSQSREDDDDKLEAVHPLPSHDIGQSAETELADDGPSGRCHLDGRIRTRRDRSRFALCAVPVNDP